jgi:hypothetical protein
MARRLGWCKDNITESQRTKPAVQAVESNLVKENPMK